jgi:CDP-4-dehydro-6-deoxyglucose reductase
VPTVKVQPDVHVELQDGETVLEGLYRHGYAYRTGCRRGGCGVCKVDLVEGTVRYPTAVSPDVLDDDELTSGTCLSCRAVPDGAVTIALRQEELRRNPWFTFADAATSRSAPPSRRPGGQSIPVRDRGDDR